MCYRQNKKNGDNFSQKLAKFWPKQRGHDIKFTAYNSPLRTGMNNSNLCKIMKLSTVIQHFLSSTCTLIHTQPKGPIRLVPILQFPPLPTAKLSGTKHSNTQVNTFKTL